MILHTKLKSHTEVAIDAIIWQEKEIKSKYLHFRFHVYYEIIIMSIIWLLSLHHELNTSQPTKKQLHTIDTRKSIRSFSN